MTNQQQFIQYATEGAKIDAIVALRLLIEAYISECGFSIGMRTLIYTASEVWCYWRLPLNPNNPLSQEQIKEPFVGNMPILYDGYKAELYDKYDIAPGYSEADFKRMCIQEIDRYDEDTMRVLCWGIYFLPKANRHFYKIVFADEEEAAAYIKKQREKLQKDIESSSTGGVTMSEFDKKYRDGTIQSFVSNQPTRNRYGTILYVDKLVDSRKVSDRVKAVQMGYGLDILMDDPSPKVQKALLDFMKLTNKSKIK